MNKLFSKIAIAIASFAMVVGVGAAAISSNREAKPVYADPETSSITITYDGFDGSPAYSSGKEYTGTFTDGTNNIIVACKYVMANKGNMQAKANDANIYNKTALPGRLVSIELNQVDTPRAFTAFGGSTQLFSSSENGAGKTPTGTSLGSVSAAAKMTWTPAENTDYTFFAIHKGANAGYISSIVVTYEVTGGGQQQEDGLTLSLNKDKLDLDLNGGAIGSLTALAVATGDANANLTAASDNEEVVEIGTTTPTSGTAFTVTAKKEGTANITVKSVWDETITATCEVTVVDTTPRYAAFKKVDSLTAGQNVLITTMVDDTYYLLPSTVTGNKAPAAVTCTYTPDTGKLQNIDANLAFKVSGNAEGWIFKNAKGNFLSASNTNNGVRVGGDEGSFIVGETETGFYLKASRYARYVGVYNNSDWRCYDSRTASNFSWSEPNKDKYNCDYINFWVEALPDQTISGDKNAYTDETVTLATTAADPTWSIVVADTTAEGANITSAGVVSVDGAGVVKVKASAEGYDDAFYTVTFIVRPTEPFAHPDTTTVNGYTGEKIEVSFTYGHINDSFFAASSNPSVATVSDFNCAGTKGTVQINLVGAGSTTVKFFNGETELATVTVNVTASTVSINGFPIIGKMAVGETQTYSTTYIVETTGTYTTAVKWESDNEAVATVDANGTVAAHAVGTANITVSSVDDPTVAETMTLEIVKPQFKLVDSFTNGKKYVLAAQSKDNPEREAYLPAGTCEFDKNPYENGTFSVSFLTEHDAWTASVNDEGQVVFYNEHEGQTYYLNAINESQGISIGTTSTGNWIYDGVGLKFNLSPDRYLICYNDTTFRNYTAPLGKEAKFVNLFFEYIPTPKQAIESQKTETALAYNYAKDGEGNFTYTDVVIRFGGVVDKDLWAELNSESKITGFGVVIADGGAVVTEKDFAEAVEMATPSTTSTNLDEEVAIDYFVPVANMDTIIGEKGNNYFWNLRLVVDASKMNKMYSAAAYIKVGDQYIFMKMARDSVETIALDYLTTRGCDETTAGGSLQAIVDNA